MFRGSHITRVDEKGRLKMPAEFKRQIDEEYGGQFYITSRDGKVGEIHPMREWEQFETKLAAVPSFNPAKQKLLKWINYFGQTAEMDGQGRVLLPQLLREKAKLMAEVVVSGNEGFLKVENHQDYEQGLEPMTMEDNIELSKVGI
jgi:MraZ protein